MTSRHPVFNIGFRVLSPARSGWRSSPLGGRRGHDLVRPAARQSWTAPVKDGLAPRWPYLSGG
jgi:hypothetical protein